MLNEISDLFDDAIVSTQSDRRITQRLLTAWKNSAQGRFPAWHNMRDVDLGEDWNWSFVVDLKKSIGFPYFIYLGQNLAKLSDVYLTGATDWTMSLLDKASEDIETTVITEAPHLRDDDLILCDGRCVNFRAITAPLAEDGETITHVFGAATGRFV